MVTTDQEPILASWKISEVLKRHPELLDTLVELSPAFGKLRNPVMRRVQSRLVTVAQAAGIAGLDPAELTRALNRAAGIVPAPDASTDAPGEQAPTEKPGWAGTAPVATELDVRPMMARGEEPFRAIMAAARAVPAGSALRLRVGFEPLPLYDALARQGFAHWGERQPDGDWVALLYRADTPQDAVAADTRSVPAHATVADDNEVTSPASTTDWEASPTAEVTIDVSELVPPEPMVKILQALETLPDDARLLVHHVRRPIHLYDRLDGMGYVHATRELGPGRVEVMIQKRAEPSRP
jgi:hypothetical protein